VAPLDGLIQKLGRRKDALTGHAQPCASSQPATDLLSNLDSVVGKAMAAAGFAADQAGDADTDDIIIEDDDNHAEEDTSVLGALIHNKTCDCQMRQSMYSNTHIFMRA
jgi:hypothetical protein